MPLGLSGDVAAVVGEEEVQGEYGGLYLGFKFIPEGSDAAVVTAGIDPDDVTEGTDPYTGPLYEGQVVPGFTAQGSGVRDFLFGGIVTGAVRVEGAIDRFVAGNVLTGNVSGGPGIIDNFAVYGDLGAAIVATTIGDTELENASGFFEVEIDDDDEFASFASGTDFAVGGRIGAVRTGGSIVASFDVLGEEEPDGGFTEDTFFESLGSTRREIEYKATGTNLDLARRFDFTRGLVDIPALYNDTFETYEPLGATADGEISVVGTISPTRDVNPDPADYYGIGVMAGQTVQVQLDSFTTFVQVIDPEGRVVASNFENNGQTAILTADAPFRFTAETAGTYRLYVDNRPGVGASDVYTLTVSELGDLSVGGIVANRRISSDAQIGDTFFSTKFNQEVGASDTIRVRDGDLGIVDAREEGFYDNNDGGTIRVPFGNLRSLSGSGVGATDTTSLVRFDGVDLRVGFSIGRIEATGVNNDLNGLFGGDVLINTGVAFDEDGFFNAPVTDRFGNLDMTQVAAGDDIQVVRSARDTYGNFVVGRGIGSIAVGRNYFNEDLVLADPRIFANADDINDDGFVDMLSVAGNVGAGTGAVNDDDGSSFEGVVSSGPAIDVGTNGNFRYFDVAENAIVVRDQFFGSFPGDDFREVRRGESFEYTDDSGTRVRLTPDEGEFNPFFNPAIDPPENAAIDNGTLEVLTYPVRSGGSILVSVRTDRSLTIENLDRGGRAVAEVGNIFLTGANGRAVTQTVASDGFTADLRFGLDGTDAFDFGIADDGIDDVDVDLNGRRYDVYNIEVSGLDTGSPVGDGRISNLINNTDGEVLSATLTSIGTLRAERVGIAETRGQADLTVANPRFVGANDPFDTEPYVIAVEGSIVEIEGDAVGNIYAGGEFGLDDVDGGAIDLSGGVDVVGEQGDGIGNTRRAGTDSFGQTSFADELGGAEGIGLPRLGELRGVIGSVRADAFGGDRGEFNALGRGRDRVERFEGIAGPIVAASPQTSENEGEIRFVDIGEGIADDGSGLVSRAGLYAEGFITTVVGTDADIRGEIIAQEINEIRLTGGSIVGADITQPNFLADGSFGFTTGREFAQPPSAVLEAGDLTDDPFYELDSIRVTGGGILNSLIDFTDIDNVSVDGGFGIFNSSLDTNVEQGVLNTVTSSDNLGIRNSQFVVGTNLNSIAAIGDAELLSVRQAPPSVRLGDEGFDFDPETGQQINATTDIRRAIGLPDNVDERRRVTNSGVIENALVTGSRDLGTYTASVTRSNLATVLPEADFIEDATLIGAGNNGVSEFPNRVSFGRNIGTYDVISTFGFQTTSGELSNVDASRDLINTLMRVSGRIEDVDVGGAVFGDTLLRAEGPDGSIGSINAGGMFGIARADVSIDEIVIANDLGAPTRDAVILPSNEATIRAGGANQPNAPIGRLSVGGDILSGVYVRATDNIDTLFVGGNIEEGAVIEADQIDDLQVDGLIFGDVLRR